MTRAISIYKRNIYYKAGSTGTDILVFQKSQHCEIAVWETLWWIILCGKLMAVWETLYSRGRCIEGNPKCRGKCSEESDVWKSCRGKCRAGNSVEESAVWETL